jgi:hypothetical protein
LVKNRTANYHRLTEQSAGSRKVKVRKDEWLKWSEKSMAPC